MRKTEELRNDLDIIHSVYFSAKFNDANLRYFFRSYRNYSSTYNTYNVLFDKLSYNTWIALIIDLNILFNSKEDFSLQKLCNKLINNYKNSELSKFYTFKELQEITNLLNNERISILFDRVNSIRDRYYAHKDRKAISLTEINITLSEVDELLRIVECFISSLELKVFSVSVSLFDYSKGEFGHSIFERLNDWDKYREKYGLI